MMSREADTRQVVQPAEEKAQGGRGPGGGPGDGKEGCEGPPGTLSHAAKYETGMQCDDTTRQESCLVVCTSCGATSVILQCLAAVGCYSSSAQTEASGTGEPRTDTRQDTTNKKIYAPSQEVLYIES